MRTVDEYMNDVIPRVFMPVMRELLTQKELATLKLSIRAAPRYDALVGPVLSGDAPIGDGDELLVVEVQGEQHNQWLSDSMTDSGQAERFYSDLQDWISETTFGWAELRGHM